MIAVELIQNGLTADFVHSMYELLRPTAHPLTLLAQTYEDNLGSNFQGAWDNFIQSGQVWALLIGFVVGYIFRSFTAY